MLEKFVVTVERAGKYFSDMWKYLKVAIQMDKSDAETQATNPNIPMTPNANVKNWLKIFGIAAAGIVFVLILIIYKLSSPASRSIAAKRSHHGYNRDGIRY